MFGLIFKPFLLVGVECIQATPQCLGKMWSMISNIFVLCLTDCKQSPWTSLQVFISWHRTFVYMICKPAIMLINIINILLKKFHNNARLYVLWLLNNPDLAVRLCVWVFAMILILSVHEKEKRFIQNFCQVNLIGGICWFLVCWTCSSS